MATVYLPGRNITGDSANLLVNTVNCVGVMGKGVAKAFADKWPEIVAPYKHACAEGRLKAGGVILSDLPNGRLWAALATKDHWFYPSKVSWIRAGLASLRLEAEAAGIHSIAIPPPGCGNGGLDWRVIEPMVLEALEPFDLRIYAASTLRFS